MTSREVNDTAVKYFFNLLIRLNHPASDFNDNHRCIMPGPITKYQSAMALNRKVFTIIILLLQYWWSQLKKDIKLQNTLNLVYKWLDICWSEIT